MNHRDRQILKHTFSVFCILAGNALYALAVVTFLIPGGIITGGTTGLALAVSHYLPVPISVFVFLFNLLMFLFGALVLGKNFALTTLISTFFYPLALAFWQRFPILSHITDDIILCTVFSGLMIGAGIGIVIRAGASTGGMDIPPLILKKKFGLPVSVTLYAFDFLILICQMFSSGYEQILYGILLVLIYTFVLDKVQVIGLHQTKVEIVSGHFEEIRRVIIEKLDRSCTLLDAQTGYLNIRQPAVMTIISRRELILLNQLVMGIDPKAFMIISDVNEVRGQGFSLQKAYKQPSEKKQG